MTDETRDYSRLTTRQKRFIECYLGECRFNASRAALAAGYATRDSGRDNLANPIIRARIEALLEVDALSRGEALRLLTEDARRTDDEILAVAERAPGTTASSVVAKLIAARTTARGHLAKAHGLLTERVEHGGGVGVRIEITGVDVEQL